MDTVTTPSLAEQIAAAQAWWRDAGVDCDFHEEPTQWLASEDEPADAAAPPVQIAAAQARPPLAPAATPPIDRSSWPTTLGDFAPWWLSEPKLDEGGLSPRIAPRGKAGASLMIIVQEPEDTDMQLLLSGRQGALLAGMLAAMGQASDDIYLAAALPRHTPLADWAALKQGGAGELLLHHIGLAAPSRVLLLGQQLPPLFGHNLTQGAAPADRLDVGGAMIPVLAARDLASLLNRPRWRAEFWRRWLEWTKEVGT